MPVWNVSDLEYHSDRTKIGSSMLKKYRESPREYESLYVTCEQEEDSDAFRVGRALHIAVLQPELWKEQVAIDRSVAKTSKHRAFRKFAASLPPDVTPITSPEADDIEAWKRAVLEHELASKLLRGGRAETPRWEWHQKSGLHIKCKTDYEGILTGGRYYFADLKTTKENSPADFRRAFDRYEYGHQGSLYAHIYEMDTGEWPTVFGIAISKTTAKAWVYYINAQALQGRYWEETENTLVNLAESYHTGNWADEAENELFEMGI